MGIQLKPAANICFDAAAARRARRAAAGAAGRGPGVRVNHAAGMRGAARRSDGAACARASQGLSAASPRRGQACREGCPGASCGGADPAVQGGGLLGPLIRAGALSRAPRQGWRSGARARTREGQAQPGPRGTHIPRFRSYLAPATVPGAAWRPGIEQDSPSQTFPSFHPVGLGRGQATS